MPFKKLYQFLSINNVRAYLFSHTSLTLDITHSCNFCQSDKMTFLLFWFPVFKNNTHFYYFTISTSRKSGMAIWFAAQGCLLLYSITVFLHLLAMYFLFYKLLVPFPFLIFLLVFLSVTNFCKLYGHYGN